MANLVALHVKLALTDERVGTEIVTDHVGGIQTVEIQNRDGLLQIHPNLRWKDDGALVSSVKVCRRLNLHDLIALGRVVGDCAEDLDSLSTTKNELHRNLADICHSAGVDNRIKLCHEGQDEITILDTVFRNASTSLRSSVGVEVEELVRLHIVFGECPLKTAAVLVGKVYEEVCGSIKRKSLWINNSNSVFCSVAIRIRRIPHQIEPHVIPSPKPTSRLGSNTTVRILYHLVLQEDPCDAIELEGIQTVLATHVEEQVQTQTTAQHEIPQIILARCQLELLGLAELGPPVAMVVLGLGRIPSNVNLLENTQLLTAVLDVGVIKPKGVVSAHHIGVLDPNLGCEFEEHLLLGFT